MKTENVVALERTYGKAKSFPLMRTITKIKSLASGPESYFVGVSYNALEIISESSKALPHGNSITNGEQYLRTSRDVLHRTKDKIESGMEPKAVYDQMNNESGGVFYSTSQSHELRDMQQVYRQRQNVKNTKKAPTKVNDELAAAIHIQRNDPDFVRTVSCLRDSYYIFLGKDIQLEDIVQFCCEKENVLQVDTTFNLCENWVTDCCYNNTRLENKDGKPPIFLGPAIIHFNKDEFLFSRFFTEMCTFHPDIKNLKIIGTDMEKAIFNGFASQSSNIRLLLCVLHLQKNDRKKISKLKPNNLSLTVNRIISDIYGRRYGTTKEMGLADSRDQTDLMERLESLKESWEVSVSPKLFYF